MSLCDDLLSLASYLPAGLDLDAVLARLTDHPGRNTVAAVAMGALLFYTAEKGRNPKVNDLFDAAVYCSTCLSVGYGDIFARTPLGKIIGTTLMTIGPALSNAALDGPAQVRHDAGQATQQEILEVLKQVLARLESGAQEADKPQTTGTIG
jgi:hypothetical protein